MLNRNRSAGKRKRSHKKTYIFLVNFHKRVTYPELFPQMTFTHSKAGISIPANASWC